MIHVGFEPSPGGKITKTRYDRENVSLTFFLFQWMFQLNKCENCVVSRRTTSDFSSKSVQRYSKRVAHLKCVLFGHTYIKIGTIQRRLAWPLRKDDTQIREAFQIFRHLSSSLVILNSIYTETLHIISNIRV